MKRLLAAGAALAAMAALLWSGARRPEPVTVGNDGKSEDLVVSTGVARPEEAAVGALLARAAAGDVAGYLDAFTGPLKDRLTREVAERGRDAFADDLRRAARARKSHAVFAPEPDGPGAATVVVESVYPDRNERQTYRLERAGPDPGAPWRVAGVEAVKGFEPTARFGAPAAFIAPEGVPVQGALSVETGNTPPDAGAGAGRP